MSRSMWIHNDTMCRLEQDAEAGFEVEVVKASDLRKAIDLAEARREAMSRMHDEMQKQAERANKNADLLAHARAALREYGMHHLKCRSAVGAPCSCGYDAAAGLNGEPTNLPPGCMECGGLMRETTKGWSCNQCGHRERKPEEDNHETGS